MDPFYPDCQAVVGKHPEAGTFSIYSMQLPDWLMRLLTAWGLNEKYQGWGCGGELVFSLMPGMKWKCSGQKLAGCLTHLNMILSAQRAAKLMDRQSSDILMSWPNGPNDACSWNHSMTAANSRSWAQTRKWKQTLACIIWWLPNTSWDSSHACSIDQR